MAATLEIRGVPVELRAELPPTVYVVVQRRFPRSRKRRIREKWRRRIYNYRGYDVKALFVDQGALAINPDVWPWVQENLGHAAE